MFYRLKKISLGNWILIGRVIGFPPKSNQFCFRIENCELNEKIF